MRILAVIIFGLSFFGSTVCLAQQEDATHEVTYLLNWPLDLYDYEPNDDRDVYYPYDLLPFIDSLALGYTYAIESGQPQMKLSLAWKPGPYGIYNNEKVPFRRLPHDLTIEAIELLAQVFVGETAVSELSLSLDSLMLAPLPDEVSVDWRDVTWDKVFGDATQEEARSYFESGFSLHNLEVTRIAFATADQQFVLTESDVPAFDPPPPPEGVHVYPPNIGVIVDVVVPVSSGKSGRAGVHPREKPREGIGRTAPTTADRTRQRGEGAEDTGRDVERDRGERTRSGDRGDAPSEREKEGKKDSGKLGGLLDDDDDEDDDASLAPAALIGAAAVGLLAIGGGTIGYYGHMSEAPIGLSAGYVQPNGGGLLQIAINEGVLGEGDKPGKLVAKATVFYDLLKTPLQPALGFGVLAEEAGSNIDITPSLSVGAVGNFGSFILYGGYDLATEGFDLSVAFNFRSKRQRQMK